MAEMRSLLAFMDADDKARVLRFYEKLFDEAGEEGEAALLKKLGSPVRQVLKVERSYREKQQAEEEAAYAAAETVVPAAAEPVPAEGSEEAEQEEDYGEAEELPDEVAEEPEEEPAEEPAEEAFAETFDEEPEEEELAEEDIPYVGLISADTFAGETLNIPAPSAEEEAEEAGENEDVSVDEGVTEIVAPPEEYDPEPAPERIPEPEQGVGAGRVIAAVFVTIPMIVFITLGICLSVALGVVGLAPGVALGSAGGYFLGYAFGGVTAFLPDILLLAGAALLCFCLALFLLWLGIWLAVGGARLTVKITAAVYRAILKRGGRENG